MSITQPLTIGVRTIDITRPAAKAGLPSTCHKDIFSKSDLDLSCTEVGKEILQMRKELDASQRKARIMGIGSDVILASVLPALGATLVGFLAGASGWSYLWLSSFCYSTIGAIGMAKLQQLSKALTYKNKCAEAILQKLEQDLNDRVEGVQKLVPPDMADIGNRIDEIDSEFVDIDGVKLKKKSYSILARFRASQESLKLPEKSFSPLI